MLSVANDLAPTSFLALGDSFTEGLNDTRRDGSRAGWADRFAVALDNARPGLRYANLAIRGRLLDQIVADQVPIALDERPDLVGFSSVGNYILRVGSDPDEVADRIIAEADAAGVPRDTCSSSA